MRRSKGFTLPEIMVTLGFFVILFAIVAANFLSSRGMVARGSNIDVMVADIKNQQAKAMSGEGEAQSSYGVRLESGRYILFGGDSFNPADPANFTVDLDPTVSIQSDTFLSSTILFLKGSGELSNFVSGQNSFEVFLSTDNSVKRITIDKFGAIQID